CHLLSHGGCEDTTAERNEGDPRLHDRATDVRRTYGDVPGVGAADHDRDAERLLPLRHQLGRNCGPGQHQTPRQCEPGEVILEQLAWHSSRDARARPGHADRGEATAERATTTHRHRPVAELDSDQGVHVPRRTRGADRHRRVLLDLHSRGHRSTPDHPEERERTRVARSRWYGIRNVGHASGYGREPVPGRRPRAWYGEILGLGDDMQQFTTRKKSVSFMIDDDVFKLRPALPAAVFFEFANIQSRMQEAQQSSTSSVADVMLDMFSKILDDASFETFNARFFGLTPNPLDYETFIEVTEYILEQSSGKGATQKS